MKHLPLRLAAFALVFPGFLSVGHAAEPDQKLAAQGYGFLKKYCYRCHGVDFKVPKYNVLDRDCLLAKRNKDEGPYITPGKPDQSEIWVRVAIERDMPPSGAKPSKEEVQTLKNWIEGGAPFPRADSARPFKSEKEILTAIRDHLRSKVDPDDRKYQRYFTLTHLYNSGAVRSEDVRLYRAALSKLVNGLSWESDIVVPQAIDKEESVFNVDLRKVGWDRHDLWRAILKVYPYGLAYDDSLDRGKQDLAKEVYDLTGSTVPYVRADWLVATASRPPLYNLLLELPTNVRVLEQRLKVDGDRNFLYDKLARAGVTTSGVSKQNRIMERHPASNGASYYWRSYDFKSNEGRGNLTKFPLGPVFKENPFPDQAFEQAGGEIIFNLPNGMQGYMLVDKDDNRIEKGPINIVRDSQETAGTPEIVNGLSCMACHKHGMIGGFKDVLRGGSGVFGKAGVKVARLFPKVAEMDLLVKKDERRFLGALKEAIGPFLQVGDDKKKEIRSFPEPIGAIARLYIKDIDLEAAAQELDFNHPKDFLNKIKNNPKLRELGVGPLAEGAGIKRELWESFAGTYSLFQKVALGLELGTPYRLRK